MPPKVIETNPRPNGELVRRDMNSWRRGELQYDLSHDNIFAEGDGPEAKEARARLDTKENMKRLLFIEKFSPR